MVDEDVGFYFPEATNPKRQFQCFTCGSAQSPDVVQTIIYMSTDGTHKMRFCRRCYEDAAADVSSRPPLRREQSNPYCSACQRCREDYEESISLQQHFYRLCNQCAKKQLKTPTITRQELSEFLQKPCLNCCVESSYIWYWYADNDKKYCGVCWRNRSEGKVPSKFFAGHSGLVRKTIAYKSKFGIFGKGEGQISEPSGIAFTHDGFILIADSNNHRIMEFNREGAFISNLVSRDKRQFITYPNCIAVHRPSGAIVFCERKPSYQIQVFSRQGEFLRSFGNGYLKHPRSIAVDDKGRIVVMECRIMRITIFSLETGELLNSFSSPLKFPINVSVANDDERIFITDNEDHCVKVFTYEGSPVVTIGNQGMTNFPIGARMTSNGHLMVADNHNSFNMTLFDPNTGQAVKAYQSRVKHAQILDMVITKENECIITSKDFRVYTYEF